MELPRNSIQIERNLVIVGAALFHKVVVRNFARLPLRIPLDFLFGVDFADLFEVRGLRLTQRGDYYDPEMAPGSVRFSYRGLDGVLRFTSMVFDPQPDELDAGRASYLVTLEPDEEKELEIRIAAGYEHPARNHRSMRFFDALEQRRSEIACFEATWSTITASNESLDLLLRRSSADLSSMIRYTPEGALMMAGIPWFTTLFGRDSILTVLLVLPFNPALAQSTLRTFAALQGAKTAPHRDEQPGKIGLTSKISK